MPGRLATHLTYKAGHAVAYEKGSCSAGVGALLCVQPSANYGSSQAGHASVIEPRLHYPMYPSRERPTQYAGTC